MAGDLNVNWIHGARNCATGTEPPLQVHGFDADTFILRQGKCSEPPASFESPFMYLLFGATRALLLDAGVSRSAATCPVGPTVRRLIAQRLVATGGTRLPLVIAHSHSHTDHTEGDRQFINDPDVQIVPAGVAGVSQFFGLDNWPNSTATFDLGGRILDILPTPGHEPSHIAIYDRGSKLLLTGDSLYPGLLVVNDWDAYRASIARLKALADRQEVQFILGAHVEMTNELGRWFGLGVSFQPDEHVLQLEARHLLELHQALQSLGAQPQLDRHADFIIFPGGLPLPPLKP
jgi:glyoxylase-like metal-dependent hydrolase (beta-lactamase superfamily II)